MASQQEINAAIQEAMKTGFNMTPREWQLEDMARILTGWNIHTSLTPLTMLLCRATGGGKSLVRDTVALFLGNVHLVITPLHGLGTDQATKVNCMKQSSAGIFACYLDEYTSGSRSETRLFDQLNQAENL